MGHPLPLGPAAGVAGRRRLGEPGHRPPVRRLRRRRLPGHRRPGAGLADHQRTQEPWCQNGYLWGHPRPGAGRNATTPPTLGRPPPPARPRPRRPRAARHRLRHPDRPGAETCTRVLPRRRTARRPPPSPPPTLHDGYEEPALPGLHPSPGPLPRPTCWPTSARTSRIRSKRGSATVIRRSSPAGSTCSRCSTTPRSTLTGNSATPSPAGPPARADWAADLPGQGNVRHPEARVTRDYAATPITVTENGAACSDPPGPPEGVTTPSASLSCATTSAPRPTPSTPTAWTSGATSSGRCWTTSSGQRDTGSRFGLVYRRLRHAAPHPQGQRGVVPRPHRAAPPRSRPPLRGGRLMAGSSRAARTGERSEAHHPAGTPVGAGSPGLVRGW